MFQILHYLLPSGENVIENWMRSLKDKTALAQITKRLDRLEYEHFGDCKPLSSGLWELRIHYGPGYRIYYSIVDKKVVLLLCGGDKRHQTADIKTAVEYLKDYKRRSAPHETKGSDLTR